MYMCVSDKPLVAETLRKKVGRILMLLLNAVLEGLNLLSLLRT